MNQGMAVVYLVRHADTAWTLTGQHPGRTWNELMRRIASKRGLA